MCIHQDNEQRKLQEERAAKRKAQQEADLKRRKSTGGANAGKNSLASKLHKFINFLILQQFYFLCRHRCCDAIFGTSFGTRIHYK